MRALLVGVGGFLVVLLVQAVHRIVDREREDAARREWNGRMR
jgi:hypothetical protein